MAEEIHLALKPVIPLKAGENYRFHFNATKCIGCKCCEVACHEQNNNPPEVKWRKVGEVEGGFFPTTKRFYFSMACNHCLDPACLTGCPVDAYYKDEKTGIVCMKDDACIGCQYCTWNCPYGAPQFNEERHMVTKCDLCSNRIAEGLNPACVQACPPGALEIERFTVETWKEELTNGNAPGLPDASITQSTTRITLSPEQALDLHRTDEYRIQPEHPHFSLIFLTVFTQLAVGGFASLFLLEWICKLKSLPAFCADFLKVGHLAMLGMALLALNTSLFHLGRPIYAFRALKMWKRSWLSREVLFFSLFAGSASFYSLIGWQTFVFIPSWMKAVSGISVTFFGLIGIYCSAMIYRVPARPSWNTWRTPVAFFATAFILGPLFALLVLSFSMQFGRVLLPEALGIFKLVGMVLVFLFIPAGVIQLASIGVKVLNMFNTAEHEQYHSAKLLVERFRALFLSRLGVLLLTLAVVPSMVFFSLDRLQSNFLSFTAWFTFLVLLTLGSEMVGRYLFFVTVVPKKRVEGYF